MMSERRFAMNNGQQAELMQIVCELRTRYPNWRLGQLVANMAGWADQDVWDVEDAELLQAARLHLAQARAAQIPLSLARR